MDEQRPGDIILHQDAVEEVVRGVLNEPGVSGVGPVWTEVPISSVEADWDNSAGAWVFNGDGTITSSGVGGLAFLDLLDAPVPELGAVLAVPVTLTDTCDIFVTLGSPVDGPFGTLCGVEINQDGEDLYLGLAPAGITQFGDAVPAPSGVVLYRVTTMGLISVLTMDDVTVVRAQSSSSATAWSGGGLRLGLFASADETATIDLTGLSVTLLAPT